MEMNGLYLVIASALILVIAYRLYGSFVAAKVLTVNQYRTTPAVAINDGVDYVPTNKWVTFGQHFAAIAGAGPLVGPVIAAQFGYLPGLLWILIGSVVAGAVHDMVILFASVRYDGKSIADIAKEEISNLASIGAMLATLFLLIITLAGMAVVVANALHNSAWGFFSVSMTIPIAIFVGIYLRWFRPGKIQEATVIGVVLIFAAIIYGPCCAQAKVGVNGTEVILREETNYPFEEMIRFTVQVSGKVDFPLYLRVPAWCKGATLIVNGETVAAGMESGKYVRLDRTWSNGDVVILQLPMSLSVQRWQTNQNSASVNYGPLTFSLLIEEEYRKVNSAENAIWDSKWQKGADVNAWPTYEIYPQSAWNYALKLDDRVLEQCLKVEKREWPSDNYPFTADNVPLVIKAQGRRVPSWGIDQYGLCGVLPEEGAPKSEILEDITLIPMGAARLRISAFPVTYE